MPAGPCVLASLLLLSGFPNASRAAPAEAWVKFQDPLEHAFTIDVPRGWSVNGGMFRLGYSDFRPMLDLRSSSGNIDIRSGDVAIPSYAFPTQYHREGEADDLGEQAQLVYARYRTGKEYASLYALTHFKTLCKTLTPQEADQTPPVTESLSPGEKTSAGAIAYRCDSGQSSRVAYVYARTTVTHPLIWKAVTLISYVALAEEVARVRGVLMHASQSFQLDAQWIAYQKKMDAEGDRYQVARQAHRRWEIGQQARQFEAGMQSMRDQVKAFQRQQGRQAGQVQSFGNVLTGLTPTIDPLDGQTRDVWTGPRGGYWQNGQGTVVNSDGPPGAGFHQLQP